MRGHSPFSFDRLHPVARGPDPNLLEALGSGLQVFKQKSPLTVLGPFVVPLECWDHVPPFFGHHVLERMRIRVHVAASFLLLRPSRRMAKRPGNTESIHSSRDPVD